MDAAQRQDRTNRSLDAGRPDAGVPTLDAAFLARQTFGDPALAREVLALFAGHLETFRKRFAGASAEARGSLLHALKGSARSVGAFPLADHVERLERNSGHDRPCGELDEVVDATLAAAALHMA